MAAFDSEIVFLFNNSATVYCFTHMLAIALTLSSHLFHIRICAALSLAVSWTVV